VSALCLRKSFLNRRDASSLLTLNSVGDQHKPNGGTTSNPFEDQPLRVTEYTAQQIATLQSRLDKQLGPEYISSRAGPGGAKVHYLAADKAISLANEIFGFNGWSSSIQNIQIDFVDENAQTGKISLGLSVIVRITLKDGTHHEDIGYGQIENCKGKAAAFEKAKKEGTTDALKRALRNFGNVLGNCVYDKTYLQKVTKLKVGATKWDESMLHRHADFAPKKEPEHKKPTLVASVSETTTGGTRTGPSASGQEETPEFEDTFELADFDEIDFNDGNTGHPDEVILPAEPVGSIHISANSTSDRGLPASKANFTTPSKPPLTVTPLPRLEAPRALQHAGPAGAAGVVPQPLPGQRVQGSSVSILKSKGFADEPHLPSETINRSGSPDLSSHHFASPQPGQVMGFYSAKAADSLDGNNSVVGTSAAAGARFNPHAESPSIRKTPGVNHNKSVPLKRDLTVDTTLIRRESPTGAAEPPRRVGAPALNGTMPGLRGPSTSAYRPPTRRGPTDTNMAHNVQAGETGGVDRVLQAARRMPLGDVSNMQHHTTAVSAEGAEVKRQRVGEVFGTVQGGGSTVDGAPGNGSG
jgi:DNA repair and recombination protein RAD52